MTELTISSEEIRSAISSYVSSLESGTSRREVGIVADTGDGIAHVEGLPSAMTNELLEFEGGVRGVALNLGELILVNHRLAALARGTGAAPERPQHGKHRSSSHQREHEPERHFKGFPAKLEPLQAVISCRVTPRLAGPCN